NIGSCAGNDSFDLGLFGLGHSELVKSLLEIVEKGFPFYRRDHQMLVGVLHRAARVLLRPAGGPADPFRDEVFEACRGNAMMGFIYPRVCIQAGIDHDPVYEVVYHCGDAIDTAEPLIKAGHTFGSHQLLLTKQNLLGFVPYSRPFVLRRYSLTAARRNQRAEPIRPATPMHTLPRWRGYAGRPRGVSLHPWGDHLAGALSSR